MIHLMWSEAYFDSYKNFTENIKYGKIHSFNPKLFILMKYFHAFLRISLQKIFLFTQEAGIRDML